MRANRYIKPYLETFRIVWQCSARLTVIQALLALIRASLPVVILFLLKLMYDEISVQLSASTQEFAKIFSYLIIIGLVFLVLSVVNSLGQLIDEAQQQKIKDYLAAQIQEKMLALEMDQFENPAFHDTYFFVQKEAMERPAALIISLRNMLQDGVSFLLVAIFLSFIHITIALVLCISVIPAVVIRVLYSQRIYEWQKSRTSMERKSDYLHKVLTSLDFAKELRIFGTGPMLKKQFEGIREKLYGERIQISKISARNTAIAKLIEVGAEIAMYVIVIQRALAGFVTIGDLVVLLQAFARAKGNLTSTLQSLVMINEHRMFLGYLNEFFAYDKGQRQSEPVLQTAEVPKLTKLSVQNLCFTYHAGSMQVLDHVNAEFAAGKVYAIVGKNGSGKSSLAKLICGLYPAGPQQIFWNDIDIRSLEPEEMRKHISLCFQDFSRYHFTAKENVRLIPGDNDLSKVQKALSSSGATEVIDTLPKGLDQQLGKQYTDGTDLSTGQWQKLAIARALYKDCDLLIMDEPTSAIDPLSEAGIFEEIKRQSRIQHKAVILITHRLYNLKMADQILVMEQGRVVEQGTHESLHTAGTRYYDMFSKQSADL